MSYYNPARWRAVETGITSSMHEEHITDIERGERGWVESFKTWLYRLESPLNVNSRRLVLVRNMNTVLAAESDILRIYSNLTNCIINSSVLQRHRLRTRLL